VLCNDGIVALFQGWDLAGGPTKLFNVGTGQSTSGFSLAHADGVLYVSAGDFSKSGTLTALDDMTGTVRWVNSIDYPATVAFSGGGAPVRLIVGTIDQVYALDPATGTEIWTAPDYPTQQTVVRNKLVYYSNLRDRSITARSALDGALLWKYVDPSGNSLNRPEEYRGVVYATGDSQLVVALDAETGAVL
jgi:outer membrane protein assembly factor BamB